MRKLIFTLFVSILSMVNANAQEWMDAWNDQHWSNGWQMMSSLRINESQVAVICSYAIGEDYYYLFEVESLGKGNYDLKYITPSDITTPKQNLNAEVRRVIEREEFAEPDEMIWKRCEIGGQDVLVRYYPNNAVNTAFLSTGREANEVMNDDLMDIISGKYATASGVQFEFANDGSCVFNGKPATYAMANLGEYGSPSLHISVGDELYEVVPTVEGMTIYPVSIPEGAPGPMTGEEPYAQLIASKDAPRWDFLSWRVCCDGAFGLLNKDVMRLMRNEMFASKGYLFSDAGLRSYFDGCNWYRPAKDNRAVKLNDVELFHVSLLKEHEK